jgi:hypothetical protein
VIGELLVVGHHVEEGIDIRDRLGHIEREALVDLDLDTGASRAQTAREWWQRLADPALWPHERLFFELYAQALQGRTHPLALTADLLEPWIGPVAELSEPLLGD